MLKYAFHFPFLYICDTNIRQFRIYLLFLYLIKIIFMKADSLFTFLGGVLVGAAVAILFAPESGDETRRKIRDSFDKEYQSLENE